jgi:threonine aldolase
VQPVQANELFVAMPEEMIEALQAERAMFYRWIDVPGQTQPVVRLVTSFTTTQDEVARFLMLAARSAEALQAAA